MKKHEIHVAIKDWAIYMSSFFVLLFMVIITFYQFMPTRYLVNIRSVNVVEGTYIIDRKVLVTDLNARANQDLHCYDENEHNGLGTFVGKRPQYNFGMEKAEREVISIPFNINKFIPTMDEIDVCDEYVLRARFEIKASYSLWRPYYKAFYSEPFKL